MSVSSQPLPPPSVPGAPEHAAHHGIGSRVRKYFLTGLIVAGPVAITFYLVWSFVTWVDDLVRPFIPMAYRPETYLPIKVPGFGLVIAFASLTLLGFFTANLVGRTLFEAGEMILERMPIIRPLYRGLKQVFETLFSQTGSSFRKVGLIEYPLAGTWSLVFLSTPPSADVSAVLPDEEHVSVFMPCTPNPTTGFFFYLPRRSVIEIDIPVDAAAKLIMSAGMIQPGSDPQRALSALVEQARAKAAARAQQQVPAK
jgi:uncharacterized membrane protein